MSKQKTYSRWWLGLATVLLAGLAVWYFRAKPAAPQAAPLAQTPPAAPVATPPDAPRRSLESEDGPPATTSTPATTLAKVSPAAQPLVSSTPASPAATPQVEPRAQLYAAPSALPQQSSAEEIAATAQMYAAHAPLRTPEVADPDSASNKQILQTMVLKALSQPAVNPPSSSLTNPAALSLSNGPSLPPSASAQP